MSWGSFVSDPWQTCGCQGKQFGLEMPVCIQGYQVYTEQADRGMSPVHSHSPQPSSPHSLLPQGRGSITYGPAGYSQADQTTYAAQGYSQVHQAPVDIQCGMNLMLTVTAHLPILG